MFVTVLNLGKETEIIMGILCNIDLNATTNCDLPFVKRTRLIFLGL
jgi:hypothetical protein